MKFLNKLLILLILVFLFLAIYSFSKKISDVRIFNTLLFLSLSFITTIFLFFNKMLKIYFFIFLFSLSTGLYLFELNILFNFIGNDINKKYEAFINLKKNNNDVVVYYPKQFKDINLQTLSGISNSRTINCNESGQYSIYQSDRYGFNNPDSEYDKLDFEYLLIGDSFVMGDCVNRPDDMASKLRSLINFESGVLSFGYPKTGILHQYAILREYPISNVKNLIIFFFEGNDFQDLAFEKNLKIYREYLEDYKFSQNIKKRKHSVDKIMREDFLKLLEKRKKPFKDYFFEFLKISNTRKLIFSLSQKDEFEKIREANFENLKKFLNEKEDINDLSYLFEHILQRMINIFEDQDTNYYLAYLPQYERYSKNYNNPSLEIVKKITKDLNIKFIDIHSEVFIHEPDYLKLFPKVKRNHYSEYGYELISNHIHKISN